MKPELSFPTDVWPSVLRYADITVHPVATLLGHTAVLEGGPDGPDWDAAPRARHFRNTAATDARPQPRPATRRIAGDRPHFWIGPV